LEVGNDATATPAGTGQRPSSADKPPLTLSVREVRALSRLWLVVSVASGAAMLGAAAFLEWRWGWQGVSVSILGNLGTAVALVSAILVIEERLRRSHLEIFDHTMRLRAELLEKQAAEGARAIAYIEQQHAEIRRERDEILAIAEENQEALDRHRKRIDALERRTRRNERRRRRADAWNQISSLARSLWGERTPPL